MIPIDANKPFTVTRRELQKLNKGHLLTLYRQYINDEMYPLLWRGFTKADILEMFLHGKDLVKLTP